MEKIDYKKKYKDLYMPKTKPMIIDVPEINFFMVEGEGNPNTSSSYKEAIEILYGMSYTIKMSKMNDNKPEGYFDYVVPPLEGLWWAEDKNMDFNNMFVIDKDKFKWISMIRQPEFVTEEVFEKAKLILSKKKPELNLNRVKFNKWKEWLCAQVMHKGSYDNEPDTIKKLNEFVIVSGYKEDINESRKHHEIYLSDPRKCKSENLKTVIRHPIH